MKKQKREGLKKPPLGGKGRKTAEVKSKEGV